MSMLDLFSRLTKSGIRLQLVDDNLKINAPKGELTPALIEELKNRKIEIVEFLRNHVRDQEGYASIRPAEKKQNYVLSSAQRRLYILQQMEEGSMSYNMPAVVILEGKLDKEKFTRACRQLILRHEMLRTSFQFTGSRPLQRIRDPQDVEFEIEYFEAVSFEPVARNGHPESIKNIISQFIRSFDLSKPPLLRLGLIDLSTDRYILMFDMHHIITDGTSMTIFLREFMVLYSGEIPGALPLQYKDFATWQHDFLESGKLRKQEEYWEEQFSDELPVLNMHTDFPRPVIQSFAGDRFNFFLKKSTAHSLNSLIEKAGATLFMILLTVFNVLLSKYTGQEDIVVGTTNAGRNHADLQNIIGIFIEALVLRNHPTGELTFEQFFHQVKQTTLTAYENQDYPFKELINKLGVENEISRNPVFDVMLIVQNFAIREFVLQDLRLLPYQAEDEIHNTAKLDLTIEAAEADEGIHFSLEYCTRLFKRETMERFARHFIAIIEEVVRQPDLKLSAIDMIPEEEKKQLLVDFNNSGQGAPAGAGKPVYQLIEDRAQKNPDHIAAAGYSEKKNGLWLSLTYSRLQEESGRLSRLLIAKGIVPGAIAGIMVYPSVEMTAALLGMLKSGAAYLPVDPGYPVERISYMLADSGAGVLVTTGALTKEIGILRGSAIETIFIEECRGEALPFCPGNECFAPTCARPPGKTIVGERRAVPSVSATCSLHPVPGLLHPAYIIYTSGTTGRPKGVLVEHRNLTAYIQAFENEFDLCPRDTVIQQVSYAFDAFVEELYPILIKGGKLVLPGREVVRDIDVLGNFIAKHQVTMITCSPQLLNEINQVVSRLPQGSPNTFASLRILISGGDRLKAGYINNLLETGDVYNTYGPTESTVCATYYRCLPSADLPANVPIGTPITGYRVYILDKYANLLPIGVPGELCAAGPGVTRGYLNRPELTAERFVTAQASSFKPQASASHKPQAQAKTHQLTNLSTHQLIYRTGDLACWLPDGNIEFLGRIDRQVKIRGYRIELSEIERQLTALAGIKEAVVVEEEKKSGQNFLAAYIVDEKPLAATEIKSRLARRLPDYMIPPYITAVREIPLTPSGKLDRSRLPQPGIPAGRVYTSPGSKNENVLAVIWQEVLEVERVGLDDNFFDLGGTSLDIFKVNSRIKEEFDRQIPVVDMFRCSTVRTLAQYLENGAGEKGIAVEKQQELTAAVERGKRVTKRMTGKENREKREAEPKTGKKPGIEVEANKNTHETGLEIAVIGMAGIFPGCRNIDELWDNLQKGIETLAHFSDEELQAEGIDAQTLKNPNYIKARGIIEEAEYFDNSFFGFTPLEAQVMDPQVRIFSQCTWHALEDAGYNPFSYHKPIGLYAGASPNLLWEAITSFSGAARGLSSFLTAQLADKDFMCTHISYKLSLNGPSLSIQSACSTSLVAIHMAVQGLLHGECDMTLAGGISINYPPKRGYIYQEGMIFSGDGHNKTFAADASGSVFGDGVGVVMLKRLAEALTDRDNIYAVIKGSAINNDGLRKVGYTAPSIDGQAEVIKKAQLMAEVEPETITYLEAHGTATPLGDTVEIEALKKVFNTGKKGFCAIGTVKSNMGHLYSAAGAAGFIKTVLALKHGLIPPSLHFKNANPQIDFADSPFYVVTRLTAWQPEQNFPLRAGVSSFGIGGTNAHVVLEEAPALVNGSRDEHSRNLKLLLLSARSGYVLNQLSENLINYLIEHANINFADAAYTLQVGRKHFPYRRMIVTATPDLKQDAAALTLAAKRTQITQAGEKRRPVYFMICGQGSQYVNMGIDLYRSEPVFREEIDCCFEILKPLMGYDLREVLYPASGEQGGGEKTFIEGREESGDGPDQQTCSGLLNKTEITQPVLFAFEYALAKLLMTWGIKPAAMIGYSFGEYVAACLTGIFSLQDALKLVIFRGQLIQQTPAGAMTSVPLPEKELQPLLPKNIYLSIVNGPTCIVSGVKEEVAEFEKEMKKRRVLCVPVNMSQAIHSPVMNSVRRKFENRVKELSLNKPRIPYISNVSAQWIKGEEAKRPGYWGDHLCSTVRFSDGLKELLKEKEAIFMEIGPGRILGMMVRVHPDKKTGQVVLNTVKHPREKVSDDYFLMEKLGQLWLQGQDIDWIGFYGKEKRNRVSLPGYPFAGKRYWIDASSLTDFDGMSQMLQGKQTAPAPDSLQAEPDSTDGFESPAGEYTAPRDDLEQAIARLWQQQMGIERIGIHDDFFYLNGSSLVATQIIARLQQEYEVEIPINLFYEEPTIAHLSEVINELQGKK